MSDCTYDPTTSGVKGMHRCPVCGCEVIPGFAHSACDDGCPHQTERDRMARASAREFIRKVQPWTL